MTVSGGGPPIDWDVLAPHIEHSMRESIVEALRWIGPLSAPDLKGVLGGAKPSLPCIAYHLTVLESQGFLEEDGERATGGSLEKIYFFAVR